MAPVSLRNGTGLCFGPARGLISITKPCPTSATSLQGLSEVVHVKGIWKPERTLQIHEITKYYDPREGSVPEFPGAADSKYSGRHNR